MKLGVRITVLSHLVVIDKLCNFNSGVVQLGTLAFGCRLVDNVLGLPRLLNIFPPSDHVLFIFVKTFDIGKLVTRKGKNLDNFRTVTRVLVSVKSVGKSRVT